MTRPLRISAGDPLVIDSSVALMWFSAGEPGTRSAAVDLLRAYERDEVVLLAPEHLRLDVVEALAEGGADLSDLERSIACLADADLFFAPTDDALLAEAVRVACSERISVRCATYVALAARLEAELVTADSRLASTSVCSVRMIA